MVGIYQHTMDPKGRLFVPSKLREELGEVFYVAPALGGCLGVHTEARWQEIVERFNALPFSKAKELRLFIAYAVKCEPDKQGRFLISNRLRDYAKLTQDVTFIGQGNYAEIWNTEAFEAEEQRLMTPEALEAAMEALGF